MSINIKQEIKQKLFRSDGKLNSAYIRREYFKTSELYVSILELTNFLSHDSTFSERIYCILNDIVCIQRCSICNNPAAFLPNFNVGYSITCSSPSCKTVASTNDRITTMIEKYGAKVSPKTRIKARDRSNQLYLKGRETLYKKHGVYNPGQISECITKRENTMVVKYGVTHISHLPKNKNKVQHRRIQMFGSMTNTVLVTDVVKRTADNRQLFEVHFKCNVCSTQQYMNGETYKWRISNNITPCTKCSGILTGLSFAQLELYNFIVANTSKEVTLCERDLIKTKDGKPLELDIVIHNLKLAIEYDGLFWHSFNSTETSEQRKSHVTKTILCEEKEYQLIHIFESDWINSKEIVMSRIRNLLHVHQDKIYARRCNIKELTTLELSEFFKQTHIQGTVGCSLAYGLFYNNKLIAAMSFGIPRYNNYQWELLRFSTSLNTSIPGAASKLFSYFIKQQNPVSVISYADRRWSKSTSSVYTQLGFEFLHNSSPNYYYFSSKYVAGNQVKLLSRVNFQKHKLKEKLDTFDETLTEAENMFANNYRRIWDCGTSVYLWKMNK